MERINDNTIRVLIGNDDLQARGITVLDLLGNHKQIENFFYSVLEEVDTDHQFQDNDSVTFQVLPTRNGLELFISKNNQGLQTQQLIDAHDSADSKESKTDLQRPRKKQETNELPGDLKRALRGHDSAPEADNYQKAMAHREASEHKSATKHGRLTPSSHLGVTTEVVVTDDFEALIKLASLVDSDGVQSDLYQYNHHYYLVLKFFDDNDHTPGMIADTMAMVYEYADESKQTGDFLAEHGKQLMEHSALELLRYYFK